MYLRIKSMQSGTAGLGMGGGDWNIQIITQKSTYFWTTTSTMMWCYRCCTTLGNGGQVTCWFSTVQRHYTIWTCTIQCGMWCMQSLEIDVENIHVQKWIWAYTHSISLSFSFASNIHVNGCEWKWERWKSIQYFLRRKVIQALCHLIFALIHSFIKSWGLNGVYVSCTLHVLHRIYNNAVQCMCSHILSWHACKQASKLIAD